MQSFSALRSNAEAKGNEVYGRTILSNNQAVQTNDALYQRMKSKITYGFNPATQFTNKGSWNIERW